MGGHNTPFPYLHGFNPDEQQRLRRQAEFGEFQVYRDVDFTECRRILEVGCGVGAQTDILLRRFPKIHVTGIDMSDVQLAAAKEFLGRNESYAGRYEILKMDAHEMEFPDGSFDGAFLCWILEHVKDPQKILREVRRVLKAGGKIFVTEVMNSTFFLDPYSPNVWKYWMAFNDYQYDGAGDPFVGAKLGNFLSDAGFKDVGTKIKTWFFDKRSPEARKKMLAYWTELLMSGAEQLINAKYVEESVVTAAKEELQAVQDHPDGVFMYSFMQARARV